MTHIFHDGKPVAQGETFEPMPGYTVTFVRLESDRLILKDRSGEFSRPIMHVPAGLATGTRVTLDDPDYGTWRGQVVVCLCKRHTWQQQVADGGPGTECGHAKCGYPRAPSACPWPLHVRWDNGNESHQSAESLALHATTEEELA